MNNIIFVFMSAFHVCIFINEDQWTMNNAWINDVRTMNQRWINDGSTTDQRWINDESMMDQWWIQPQLAPGGELAT